MTSSNKQFGRVSVVVSLFFSMTLSFARSRAQEVYAPAPQSNEATILLTAVDKGQHFVSTLNSEDLHVFENGNARKITSFRQVTDQHISLAILIDTSVSQERTLPRQRLAAKSFIDSVIRSGGDEVAVATFTGILRIEQKLTDHIASLQEAIARVRFVPPNNDAEIMHQTALWDSISTACSELLSQSKSNSRPAIILLTDGQDNISKMKISDAIERAISGNVVVFSIGIGDGQFYFGVNKGSLRKLSEQTGGRAFFPKKVKTFNRSLRRLSRS